MYAAVSSLEPHALHDRVSLARPGVRRRGGARPWERQLQRVLDSNGGGAVQDPPVPERAGAVDEDDSTDGLTW